MTSKAVSIILNMLVLTPNVQRLENVNKRLRLLLPWAIQKEACLLTQEKEIDFSMFFHTPLHQWKAVSRHITIDLLLWREIKYEITWKENMWVILFIHVRLLLKFIRAVEARGDMYAPFTFSKARGRETQSCF